MTYLEKFREEHPEYYGISDREIYGCKCVDWEVIRTNEFETDCDDYATCKECWLREIPDTEPTDKKEKKKMATRKTKTELLEALEQTNNEIRELKKEVERVERYKAYDDMAAEIKAVHDSFVNAGFSEEMANQMVMTIIDKTAMFAKK